VYLKNKDNEAMLKKLIFNRRHIHLSVWLLTQSFTQLPLSIRKTLSHFLLFKPRNKKEAESIFEELIFIPKEISEAVMTYTFKGKHDFLFGNVETGTLYRNFNELVIE
jgi:predicted neutral ceramidase superfamily lipid hydrolase